MRSHGAPLYLILIFPPFSFCSSILFFFLSISYSLSDFAVNNVDSTSISLNPLPSLSSKKEKEFPSSLLHKGFFILYTKRFSLSLLKMSFFFHFLIQSPFHPFSFFLSHTGPDQRKNVQQGHISGRAADSIVLSLWRG